MGINSSPTRSTASLIVVSATSMPRLRSRGARRDYKNRSEALRDVICEALLGEAVDSNKPVVGTLTLVYDHHVPGLSQKLKKSGESPRA